MNETLMQLRHYWHNLGCLNDRPARASEISAFEQHYGLSLPPLLREYFSNLNGTRHGSGAMEDDDYISFWHLDQVRTIAEETKGICHPAAARLFIFADWSIHCHVWAVHLSDTPNTATPVFICYPDAQEVASSFETFTQRYVARDYQVLFPEPNRHP